jgi:hypothetical protein
VGIHDQIKSAFQEIDGVDARLTVQIDALRTEMGSLRGEMGSLRSEMGSLRGELVAEIRRVDGRIDGLDRELKTAIDVRECLAALEARRPA